MGNEPSDPAAPRRVDLHSHLIPGIDDGCQTIEESLACVDALIARGYVGTVCTPHVYPALYPENTPANIRQAVQEIAEVLKAKGKQYSLWAGGEVRLTDNAVRDFERHGVPTLGHGRYVLVDYFGRQWPPFGDAVCDYLLDRGYQPLLAHPERMSVPALEWFRVLDRLTERGVQLQCNLNSLTGNEGKAAQDVAVELLNQDRYTVLAMDMHGVDGLPSRFNGIAIAERLVGSDKLRRLTEERPWEIVTLP
jgi:protein-tyrosine phosphatase